MQPKRLLDGTTTPDGRELELSQRGDDYLIQIDRLDLMGSRAHGSEEAMAAMALGALGGQGRRRWLVGGLGMGFTLRACLDTLPPSTAVVVAEVFDAVVTWNRGPLGHLAGHPLRDPRVRIEEGDVYDHLGPGCEPYDAILLDVDNGPEALTLDSNRRLYRDHGLRRLRRALSPGGVLAVWSASRDDRFRKRLGKAGFRVECRQARERPGKGARHTIFLATLPR
ncbi:MAG: hypothetical protein AAGD06_26115 [Acidobacteriota bacterium]